MLQAILLGIIQGITEFLPISSSGHLLLFHQFFGEMQNSLALDATLHLATALALLIYFRNDWIAMVKNWRSDKRLQYIIIGSLPAAIAGLLFEDFIATTLRSPWVVVTMLILVALLMILAERIWLHKGSMKKLYLHKALLIGFAQALALVPGTSRSAITIVAGMSQKLSRQEAARFAFLLGTPITFGAGFIKLPELYRVSTAGSSVDLFSTVLAFITTFVVGFITINWLLKFLEKRSLTTFAVYRIFLAVLTAVWLLL